MLSKRLKTVANMVTKGNIVADIGTDHGYVPIYLIKNNIAPFVYAMDINEGPVEIAKKNIKEQGVSDKIAVVQSDGMEKLQEGMASSIVIAGMGGELMIQILKQSQVMNSVKELILSPHRDWDMVRKYVIGIGWHIEEEKMIMDAGKYYVVMKVEPGLEKDVYDETDYNFGRKLLLAKDSVLKEYLIKEINKFQNIKDSMKKNDSENINQINKILDKYRKGLDRYA